MEQHKKCLKTRCRACGRKVGQRNHPKTRDPCGRVLSTVYNICVETEDEDIYPPDICNSCYLVLRRASLNGDIGRILDIFQWLPHDEECDVCTGSAGGRPKKRAVGRPNANKPSIIERNIVRKIGELHTHEFTNFPVEKSSCLQSPFLEDLICRVCQCVPRHPIEVLTCRHFLCMSCTSTALSCPCNGTTLLPDQLSKPSDWVMRTMGSLLVHCKQKCGEIVELQHLTTHLQSKCTKTPVPPSSAVSVDQLVTHSASEGHMFTYLKKSKGQILHITAALFSIAP